MLTKSNMHPSMRSISNLYLSFNSIDTVTDLLESYKKYENQFRISKIHSYQYYCIAVKKSAKFHNHKRLLIYLFSIKLYLIQWTVVLETILFNSVRNGTSMHSINTKHN